MTLHITKIGALFTAEGTLDGKIHRTESALSATALIAWLKQCGFHQTDIGDAMYGADPTWLERLDVNEKGQ